MYITTIRGVCGKGSLKILYIGTSRSSESMAVGSYLNDILTSFQVSSIFISAVRVFYLCVILT
jgi:hypothetical protein